MTMMKNFAIREQKSVQLRMEAYNLTNTPSFGRPNSTYGNSNFGIISGYAPGRGPREMQLGIKFYY
jgi:hypothetical protein